MSNKKSPQKPDRPIGAIIFPGKGKGPVRSEFEHLPRDQKPLELTIGQKFIGAMSHFGHAELTDLILGEEPADLFCTDATGQRIGMQVTEMIDPVGVLIDAHRDIYIQELSKRCADTLKMFSGCAVQITDDGMEDFFPPLNSPEGQTFISEMTNQLAALAGEIDSLALNQIRVRKWTFTKVKNNVGVFCQRHLEAGTEIGCNFSWGRQRGFKKEEGDAFLPNTINNKILKSYTSPSYKFWLLVYSTDKPVGPDDASVALAGGVLDAEPHPFEKVWYFFPYHNRDLGHIVPVWARK